MGNWLHFKVILPISGYRKCETQARVLTPTLTRVVLVHWVADRVAKHFQRGMGFLCKKNKK